MTILTRKEKWLIFSLKTRAWKAKVLTYNIIYQICLCLLSHCCNRSIALWYASYRIALLHDNWLIITVIYTIVVACELLYYCMWVIVLLYMSYLITLLELWYYFTWVILLLNFNFSISICYTRLRSFQEHTHLLMETQTHDLLKQTSNNQ